MTSTIRQIALLFAFLLLGFAPAASAQPTTAERTAAEIVRDAVDYWRDTGSETYSEMVVHRPSWERAMSMHGWTQGMNKSLIRFTAPARDAGNASLTVDDEVWTFSPKVNRIIKIPPSMKSQSWMGSDFSYRDLARADDIVDDYNHRLLRTERADEHDVYVVESVPLESAPVVWGREVLRIRDDNVMLQHLFYDQDNKLVKKMTSTEIRAFGEKLYPAIMRMEKVEEVDEWTEVRTSKAEFGVSVPDYVFTLSNLRNPRSGR
ncbi:MAG: outer membrane lipoprotein-sorting protein [Bdellovibrionales bacterium]|nr:outer membrane lipoprotein-sorting protein [Bdellovibrionales bacterium]